jgi:hypothetical protein
VALPLYVRVPGINLVLFPTLNGYLLSRGYFEVIALRRLHAAMRNRFAGRIDVGGVVIFALASAQVGAAGHRHGLYGARLRNVARGPAATGGMLTA